MPEDDDYGCLSDELRRLAIALLRKAIEDHAPYGPLVVLPTRFDEPVAQDEHAPDTNTAEK